MVGNGVELFLNHGSSVEKNDDGCSVTANGKPFHTKYSLNASGIGASEICHMVTEDAGFER